MREAEDLHEAEPIQIGDAEGVGLVRAVPGGHALRGGEDRPSWVGTARFEGDQVDQIAEEWEASEHSCVPSTGVVVSRGERRRQSFEADLTRPVLVKGGVQVYFGACFPPQDQPRKGPQR